MSALVCYYCLPVVVLRRPLVLVMSFVLLYYVCYGLSALFPVISCRRACDYVLFVSSSSLCSVVLFSCVCIIRFLSLVSLISLVVVVYYDFIDVCTVLSVVRSRCWY